MRLVTLVSVVLLVSGIGARAQEESEAKQEPPTDADQLISAEFPFESRFVDVMGSKMHYIEEGEGDPILFLHGNPTSSYLWRNVIPHVSSLGRCIAPDLIGMGKSGKPELEYTFFDHAAYLDAFMKKLELTNVTLVIHDWGSGLGFHYAARHPENIRAIAFMEGMAKVWESWEDFPPVVAPLFKQFRTKDVGWQMLAVNNMFVEQMLPGGVSRKLRPEEMNHYRAPFPDESSRKPVWQWPQQVPVAGAPAGVAQAVRAYSAWLQETDIPKLMFHVTPGVLMPAETVQWCKENFSNLDDVHLGPGVHYIQEDYPHTIGKALAEWIERL